MKVTSKQLTTIGVAVLATTLTYAINYHVNLGPLNGGKPAGAVVAASTVGMLGALFLRDYAVACYIAAFAGMSATTVIPSILYAPIFGLMAGIFSILMAKLFIGYGGKAGTTAFCATNVTLALFLVFGALGLTQHNINAHFRALTPSDLDLTWVFAAVVAAAWGLMGTVLLRERVLQKRKAPNESILGSAVIKLVSALALPWIVPSMASKVAAIVASGTYAGMVSRKVVSSDAHLLLAGVVVGLLNVFLSTIFMGVGGKLGLMGLLGIALFHHLEHKPIQVEAVKKA